MSESSAVDAAGNRGDDATATAAALDHVEMAFGVLARAGVPAFLTAGALLGAMRDGRLIGPGRDVALGYLSAANTAAGIALESYRLERLFRQRRIDTRRFSAGEFRLLLRGPIETTAIDVCAAFRLAGEMYLAPNVELPAGARPLLPLGDVGLEDRRFPTPAAPAELLAVMYGPTWQDPASSTRREPPAWVRRRLDGWLRGSVDDRFAWQRWHLERMTDPPRSASPFARWVASWEPALAPGVDLGCGAGADAVWLAGSGRYVLGLDYAPHALARARAAAKEAGVSSAQFDECAFGDTRAVLARGARLARARPTRSLYARGLVEQLSPTARNNVWRLASMSLRRGGRLYVELGATAEPDAPVEVRRRARELALTPETVVAEIAAHGGRLEHQEPVDDADPQKTRGRLVATWHR